jgi:hypothetical protein
VKKIEFTNEIARFSGLAIYAKKASSTNATTYSHLRNQIYGNF